MRKKLLSIVVLSILVASILVGCSQGQSTPTLTIFSISGQNVSVMKAGTGSWIGVQVGMSLAPGDAIKCGDNSSAEITFLDGTTIDLQAGTEIEVDSLATTDTGSTTIVLEQTIGSIIFRVTKIIDPASRYEVDTPTGAAVVRGSAMQVSVAEDGTTEVCNLEGDIWVVAQGVELQISQGQCCIIRPGQSPKLLIRTWYDLDAIRDNLGGNYTLVNNLDSTTAGYAALASSTANGGTGWEPIGNYSQNLSFFYGQFDGQGYEIRDLVINRPGEIGVGLFGFVLNVTIKDIGVVNANVTGNVSVGGLVGINIGIVSNSYSTGNVSGVGVMGSNTSSVRVGGLVGFNDGGIVSRSHSSADVTGAIYVGGLVGYSRGIVGNSYSTGNVSGSMVGAGGLVGDNYGTVRNSYSIGNVSGSVDAGGLVGYNSGAVNNSYSAGRVSGSYSVGGLVGGCAINCTVSNSFFDIQTSGQGNSTIGMGKTTAEMKDIATFLGAGWNIIAVGNPSTRNPSYIWNIVNNVTYPFLSWQ